MDEPLVRVVAPLEALAFPMAKTGEGIDLASCILLKDYQYSLIYHKIVVLVAIMSIFSGDEGAGAWTRPPPYQSVKEVET
jgi:hypothetical protein